MHEVITELCHLESVKAAFINPSNTKINMNNI